MADFDASRLTAVIARAGRDAFSQVRKRHAGEAFYCMGLVTTGSFGYLVPTAMTEEGLDRAVRDYRRMPRYADEPLERLRLSLRWSFDDSLGQ